MLAARRRQASLLPSRDVPRFCETFLPLRKAFPAVAARDHLETGDPTAADLPLFSLRRSSHSAPAPAARAVLLGTGTSTVFFIPTRELTLSRTRLLPSAISSALAPSSEACTDVRCANRNAPAIPFHANSFARRTPRAFRLRGEIRSSRSCTVRVISPSVCRICSRISSADACCS